MGMENPSRRSAMRAAAAGTVGVGASALGGTAPGDEPKAPKLWTLEGGLKIHPKYLYRYYLVLGNGQMCALYGSDHGREPAKLGRLTLPARIRVRGVLGTAHHSGGTKENLSPFPETWTLYMDVHEVETLK
jgi:hypothetical protein